MCDPKWVTTQRLRITGLDSSQPPYLPSYNSHVYLSNTFDLYMALTTVHIDSPK